MDLVVFPEYSLHGLSMDTNPEIMCRMDGPEVEAFREACRANKIWGCFSIMELNLAGNPYNTGIILDADGELRVYYRKLHPWIPVEPWEPGDLGIPVCDGCTDDTAAIAQATLREPNCAGLRAEVRDAWPPSAGAFAN